MGGIEAVFGLRDYCGRNLDGGIGVMTGLALCAIDLLWVLDRSCTFGKCASSPDFSGAGRISLSVSCSASEIGERGRWPKNPNRSVPPN